MKRLLKLAATLFVAGCLLAGLGGAAGVLYVRHSIQQPLNPGEESYVIKPGASLKSFANELKRRGVIDETLSLQAYAWWTGQAIRIKAGEYRLEPDQTLAGVLQQLVDGKVVLHSVQFIEGWTFAQLREALAQSEQLVQVTGGKTSEEIMTMLGADGQHPEGRFFPDTYRFGKGTRDLDILTQAYNSMQAILEQEWQNRFEDIPLKSPYEALILASIVEKETGKAEERPTIAGVFTNRLNRKMRLQTDPTVIYGMGDAFDGNIRRKDLRTDTPYNTYTRAGLPPTPIAMPGREAIRAAVQPEATKAIYFVSRGDGSHQFSETLKQHNKAVRKYQLKRRAG